MTTTTITTTDNAAALLLDGIDNKDQQSRVEAFVDWLALTGGDWRAPDLAAYRDWLMSADRQARNRHSRAIQAAPALSATSARAHLSSVRARYKAIIGDNRTRDALYSLTSGNAADRKAFVDEMLQRLENAVKPDKSTVKIVNVRDVEDSKHLRLTVEQANALLDAPLDDRDNTPLQGVRDTAILALMLCTGVRDMELCALDVDDLRQQFGGALALRVRAGKGAVQRMIPYGSLDWCLAYVDKWLEMAGISSGAVFRGIYKGGKRARATRLTMRAIQDILDRYPVNVGGVLRTINPHDTRRTYARRLYEANVPLLAIQQNLGHADSRTTQGYIGTLDADQRKPPRIYRAPHTKRLEAMSLL